jgi:flagellar biosynthesis protein FliP
VRRMAALAALAAASLSPSLGHAAAAAHGHDGGLASRPLVLILAMGALSLIPFAFLMVTSFVRISVVLSILRSAIGTPSVPPTQVLTGLAMVLTLAVMAPTGERMYAAVAPTLGMAAGAELTGARNRCASSCSSTRAPPTGPRSRRWRSRCAARPSAPR